MERTIIESEQIFTDICTNAYPAEWDENHITFSMMRKFREMFDSRTLHFEGWSKTVRWKSFKNRGAQETKYGDIALLVTVQFSSGQIIKGVACLEAKRLYNSGGFGAVNETQLERTLINAPHSHLLLYFPQITSHPAELGNTRSGSCIWSSPINTAIQYLKQTSTTKNISVIRVALRFSRFLVSRVFWGLDLDFRPELYKEIESGIEANGIIPAKYVAKIDVYYSDQEPSPNNLSDNWEEI